MVRLNADIHPNLSEMVTENLRRRNVITIVDFVAADPIKLTNFTGLSHTDILQVKQHISKKFGGLKRNVTELLATEHNCIIPTNIERLDELLKGGLYPGQLCELCGLSSSGKTQLCLTIAANVAVRSDTIIWYFDTKKDFSRLRYEEILKARSFEQEVIEDTLQRTRVCRVHSFCDLIQTLRQLVTRCRTKRNVEKIKDKKPFLVIIDSLTAIIFRVTRSMRQDENDLETIHELDNLAELCRFLTVECRAVVVTVNSVTQWDFPGQMESDTTTPALGIYWARVPVTRLLIIRQHSETRKITVLKDLRLDKNSSCIVTVTNAGIMP